MLYKIKYDLLKNASENLDFNDFNKKFNFKIHNKKKQKKQKEKKINDFYKNLQYLLFLKMKTPPSHQLPDNDRYALDKNSYTAICLIVFGDNHRPYPSLLKSPASPYQTLIFQR